MERILVLGTGGGLTVNCYSTCFLLQNDEQYLLVDTGSGNQLLNQIKAMKIDINQIHDLFISHKHIDHLLGIFPLIRKVCQQIRQNKYTGYLNIYCDKEIKNIVDTFIASTFHEVHEAQYKEHVRFHFLQNEQKLNIIGYEIQMLDLYSEECMQYGFQTKLNNGKMFTFLGDIPCNEKLQNKIQNTDWVCHEVFCLETENEKFHPHQIYHSTVKDVAENMQALGVKNLVLWHAKDNLMEKRKELYTKEAKQYFEGNVYVPDDLEIIEL